MTKEFENRVALVTGGSRGIGRATALRLADEGADVAISYVSRTAEADSAVAEIEKRGRKAIAVVCDVSQPDQVAAMVTRTNEELGTISFLAHCGGISNTTDHNGLSWELWREMIDVNLNGAYLTVFAVKDQMVAQRCGRIVLISSVAALLPRGMQIHYAASKAGVLALTRCCADGFAEHQIRINAICPGLIETEMAHVLTPEKHAEIVSQTPLRRLGEPEEIASVVRFLLSDESSFMTGQTIVSSGGRMMMA
jgi:3-oxoacyl-[acyl-carrier protein] reductase